MAKGFNRPAGGHVGGNNMMQQLRAMQEQLEATQAQLAEETITVTVGGGAIKITMSGDQHCKAVEINPDVLQDADAEMLQDLMLSAINLAIEQSRQLAAERLGPLTGGLPGIGF